MVRLSALRTGHLYPPGNIPGTNFCSRLSQPQGHGAAIRIMLKKNSNDTIWNRTRDLPACSAVPQPNVPSRDIAASSPTKKRRPYRHVRERRRIGNFFCRPVSWRLSFQRVFCIQLNKAATLGTSSPNFQLFWWSANWVTPKVAKRVASLPNYPNTTNFRIYGRCNIQGCL